MKRNPKEIVVTCGSGSHRVRLGRGLRFWRSARCPKCRARVDPFRGQRVWRWLLNLGTPLSSGWLHRGVCWGSLAFLAFALVSAAILWVLSDRWWPATTLLFGPRWVTTLPLLGLVPGALLFDRRMLGPLGVAGLVLVGPVIGIRTGWRQLVSHGTGGSEIRVVTFNARSGTFLIRSPRGLLMDWNADVAAFQECGSTLWEGLQGLDGWQVHRFNRRLCLATRFGIGEVSEMDREVFEFAGGSGLVVTYRLDPEGAPFYLTNVHLETPRKGLELIRMGRIREGIAKTEEKSFLRDAELRRARSWVDRFSGPHLVVGDFNTPPESWSYRRAWSDWQNAFSLMGRGLGGTRLNGWIRARIDHVVADDAWEIVEAEVGQDVGSDHLPMIATVRPR